MTTTINKGETSILHFKFDEKVPILVSITDSKDIKFIRRKENNNTYVTGFKITIKGSTGQKIDDAIEQTAPRLTNILSSVTGLEINYKPPKIKMIRNGKISTVVYKIEKIGWLRPIDINNIDVSKLTSSLLAKDTKLNMQLAHEHNAHRAFFSKDYSQAIREFYLVFEYTGCIEEIKYRNLRHAVSHNKLDCQKAIDDLQINFKIPIQLGQYIDVDNPKIKKILGEEAEKLRHSVGLYLNNQLKNELMKKK